MKKGRVLGLLAMSAVLLAGCVDSMPELTDDQSDIISEYAAGVLLKYSPNYNYKIVSEEEVAAAMEVMEELQEESATAQEQTETDVTTEEETKTETEAPDQTETSEENGTESQDSGVEIVEGSADTDFAAELGIENLILRYQSYELCSSYPNDNAGFSVDAAQDKKLLVVHFDLESADGQDAECNLFAYGLHIKFNINDVVSADGLITMLPNDLATYMDTIPAGESADVVAVAEISDISDADISSLTIQMTTDSGSYAAKLK